MVLQPVCSGRGDLTLPATAKIEGNHLSVTPGQLLGQPSESGEVRRETMNTQQQRRAVRAPSARANPSGRQVEIEVHAADSVTQQDGARRPPLWRSPQPGPGPPGGLGVDTETD